MTTFETIKGTGYLNLSPYLVLFWKLFEQDHLIGVDEFAGIKSIEVYPSCDILTIKDHGVLPILLIRAYAE